MQEYILPTIILTISDFIFLQNKKPDWKRPVAFDDPWGPIIYIPLGLIGLYLFFNISILDLLLGFFYCAFIAQILSLLIYRGEKGDKNQSGFIKKKVLWIAIIGVIFFAIFATAGYVGIKYYQNYSNDKLAVQESNNKLVAAEKEKQDAEIQTLKKEIENIKVQQTQIKNKPSSQSIDITTSDLQKYSSDVGKIYCYGDNGSQASGTLWQMDSLEGLYVITNRHAIVGNNCHIFFEDPTNIGASIGRYKLDTNNIKSWNNKTDVAFLKILYPSIDSAKPLSSLSSKTSSLVFCSDIMPIGAPVAVIGYPAFAQKTWGGGGTQAFQAVTEGTISAYDDTVQYSPTSLPDVNYFISAKIDSGSSGGIVFSKTEKGLCVLGIPTWISLGNYETQGMAQNIHNVTYVK